ncbi:esterase-like activity of phytase family protein [Nocardia sp. NPDC050406]|uniref:esterase-like activity of phytase family protein n=1 Tax=Nocardia sp. NPDC050406 TaxID=3364318 RepID=UPI0037A4A035
MGLRRTTVVLAAAGIAAGSCVGVGQAEVAPVGVRYVNSVVIGDDVEFDGEKIGGLSGIDYDPESGSYVAISDNRGESGPVRAYTLRLPVGADGRLGAPEFERVVALRNAEGELYPPRTADPEAIRWTPDRRGFYYTSEGEAKVGQAGFVRQATLDGGYVRDLPLPEAFSPRLDASGQLVAGIRDNQGFEPMTLDGGALVTMSENTLVQDGPESGIVDEGRARLVRIDAATGADLGEYLYPVDRAALVAAPGSTGVSEILALDEDRYLSLERGMIPGLGFTARLYETTTAGADPVTGTAVAPTARTMPKRLLFDFRANGIDPECAEGLTFGPTLPDGTRTLIIASDNNFGRAGRTAFHLFALDGVR